MDSVDGGGSEHWWRGIGRVAINESRWNGVIGDNMR